MIKNGHIGKEMLFEEIGLRPGRHFRQSFKSLDKRPMLDAEKAQLELE